MSKKRKIFYAIGLLLSLGGFGLITMPALIQATTTTPVLYGTNVPATDSTANNTTADVVGSKADTEASGAVTSTDSIVAYIKQIVSGQIAVDAYFDVPTANVATNATVRDVVGNKTDTAVGAVTTDKSLMGYTKGVLEDTGTTIPALHAVPNADVATNTNVRDVVGNKTDAAVGSVTTDKSLMGYTKGILEDTGTTIPALVTVPNADVATNTNSRDVVGNKTDAAVGAVTTDKSLMGYTKGILEDTGTTIPSLITSAVAEPPTAKSLQDILHKDGSYTFDNTTDSLEAIADAVVVVDGLHDVPTKDAATDTYMRDVVGRKTDTAAAGAVSETESLVAYAKQNVTNTEAIADIAWAQMAYQMGSVPGSASNVLFWFVDANIGASGDGTTPATAFKTIQEAIAACSNSHDDWIFVFDYSGGGATITMDKSMVHLIGNSTNGAMAYPRIKPASAVPGITFAATGDRVEIANLVIGGGDQTVAAISFPVATAAGAYGVNIHDCVIGRDADAPCLEGIEVESGGAAPYLVVKNNRFYGSDGAGIAAAGSAVRISGNATRCNISSNYIQDVGRTATPAIWLDGAVTNPQIENNRIKIDTDTGTGSAITLGASVDDGWIAGNWASDGKDAPGNNPFVDAGSTNGWAENYSGIVAVLP